MLAKGAPGVGVTKALFSNFSVTYISDLKKIIKYLLGDLNHLHIDIHVPLQLIVASPVRYGGDIQ